MYPPTKAHYGPNGASKMELFAKIVYVFKLMLLTIFAKNSVVDIWRALVLMQAID